MELHFASRRLQRVAESAGRSDALLGKRDAALMRQRLCELAAADNLLVAKAVPTLGLRQLPDRSCYSVRVNAKLCLTFQLIAPAQSTPADCEIDIAQVVAIRIVAIEECDGR